MTVAFKFYLRRKYVCEQLRACSEEMILEKTPFSHFTHSTFSFVRATHTRLRHFSTTREAAASFSGAFACASAPLCQFARRFLGRLRIFAESRGFPFSGVAAVKTLLCAAPCFALVRRNGEGSPTMSYNEQLPAPHSNALNPALLQKHTVSFVRRRLRERSGRGRGRSQ